MFSNLIDWRAPLSLLKGEGTGYGTKDRGLFNDRMMAVVRKNNKLVVGGYDQTNQWTDYKQYLHVGMIVQRLKAIVIARDLLTGKIQHNPHLPKSATDLDPQDYTQEERKLLDQVIDLSDNLKFYDSNGTCLRNQDFVTYMRPSDIVFPSSDGCSILTGIRTVLNKYTSDSLLTIIGGNTITSAGQFDSSNSSYYVQRILADLSATYNRRAHSWSCLRQLGLWGLVAVGAVALRQRSTLQAVSRKWGPLAAGLGTLYLFSRSQHTKNATLSGAAYAVSIALDRQAPQNEISQKDLGGGQISLRLKTPTDPWAAQIANEMRPKSESAAPDDSGSQPSALYRPSAEFRGEHKFQWTNHLYRDQSRMPRNMSTTWDAPELTLWDNIEGWDS